MPDFNRKKHWESIYTTKEPDQVSWYQLKPVISLELIEEAQVEINADIIDIGGGDSLLVDHLLDVGYTNITVLDVSASALSNAKKRLNKRADLVTWIQADASQFEPNKKYSVWHDRAAFHFLTENDDIQNYIRTAADYIKPEGSLIIGTFSENGPTKCSGIEIRQYSKQELTALFNPFFEAETCFNTVHQIPFGTTQDFTFCRFRRRL